MSRQAQNFVTILTKIHPEVPYDTKDIKNEKENSNTSTLSRLEKLIEDELGNYPHSDLRTKNPVLSVKSALDDTGLIHFASMHVIRGQKASREPHYLFLELTVDGPPETAIRKFVEALGQNIIEIYKAVDENLNTSSKITKTK